MNGDQRSVVKDGGWLGRAIQEGNLGTTYFAAIAIRANCCSATAYKSERQTAGSAHAIESAVVISDPVARPEFVRVLLARLALLVAN